MESQDGGIKVKNIGLKKHHDLHTSWEFWYYKRPSRDERQRSKSRANSDAEPKEVLSYRDQLKPLGKISSLEDFFQFYVFMRSSNEMPREIDLFFFRHGEVPMWEESPKGGIWITKVKKDDDADRMWEALLLALIGEQFAEPNVIGVSLSLRTKEKLIQVWLKDATNQKMKALVSNRMRHFMKLDPDSTTLYFKDHQNSIKDGSTMKNALGYKFEKKKKDEPSSPQGHSQKYKEAPWMNLAGSKDRKFSGKFDQERPFQTQKKNGRVYN